MATDDIAAQILNARRDAVERMFATKPGQEVCRLDAAFRALTGQEPPDLFGRQTPTQAEEPKSTKRGPRADSMLSAVKRLLQSRPVLWTYDSLADALAAEGMESRKPDGKPKTNIRGAAFQLVNSGDARRGPNGTVYATEHHDEIVEKGLIPDEGPSIFSQVAELREVG